MAVKQRSGGLVILVISIVAGLVAAVLSVSFLRGMAQTTTVLVATQEIQPFTALTPEMYTKQQLPTKAVPADAITDTAMLEGRYARTLVPAGTPLRAALLASASGHASSLAAQLTDSGIPGTRALAIPVDEATGVGGTLEPGDHVDVIAAVKIDRTNAPPVTMSKVIARAVPVLAKTAGDATTKGTIVLQVTPAQAEEIAFSQMAGKVYLATNPYKPDRDAIQTSGVTPDTFLQRYGGR